MAMLSVSLDVAIKYLKLLCSKLKRCQFYKQVITGGRSNVTLLVFSCKSVISVLFMNSICSKKVSYIMAITCPIGRTRGKK